ncbi:hypothetical protein [Marinicella marina]|nr:hypothetical protein [Marinicella marina]
MTDLNYDFSDESSLVFNLQSEQVVLSNVTQTSVDCATVPSPPLISQPPLRLTYTEINDGFPFGESTSTNVVANFTINQHVEIADLFTDQVNFRRKLQFYPTPSNYNSPFWVSLSISECPGDFTETAVCNRVLVPVQFPQVRVSTYPDDPTDTYCVIEPGKSYYLNMLHDQDPFDEVAGRCAFQPDSTCAVIFGEISDQ